MRCSTVSGLMMAALIGEAVAGPAHAHLHQRAHQKKDVDWENLDWDNMSIDWAAAYANGKASKTAAAAAVATPTVAAVAAVKAVETTSTSAAATPAASASSSSSASDSVSAASVISDITDDISELWEGLVGAANDISSFGEVVQSTMKTGALSVGDVYVGNFGNPYGHNVMKVSSTTGYDFTNTFINTGSETMTINIWNKVGPDKLPLSGSALAPKNTTLTFVLAPGKSQIVAVQENSQLAWAQASKNFAASGAFAESWGEANFVPTGSGYDLSAIMSSGGNNYNMSISSKEVECISDPTQNFWLKEYTPIGGSDGSCYVPDSTMHLTTKMGGYMS